MSKPSALTPHPKLTQAVRTSPLGKLLQREVYQIDQQAQRAWLGFTITDTFLNRQGILHGGVICTMLDSMCGFTLWAIAERRGPTLEMQTSFLRACAPGAYRGYGEIKKLGRSIAFMEAALFDSKDQLVARASATFQAKMLAP